MKKIENLFLALANAFPVWVLLGAGLALWEPATATWFKPGWIPVFLGVIMLSMGLTLDFEDFLRVLKIPRTVLLGVALQYLIMPLLGFAVARAFRLPMDYVVGLILVGCAPGGTASNVVCFVARANVPLSVTLTTCTTLMAAVMTPLLSSWSIQSISRDLTGTALEVDTLGLLLDTFQVVILPVAAGIFLNRYVRGRVEKINPYLPFVAVLSIVFIVDYILAAKRQDIMTGGATLIAAVVVLHGCGFFLGYGLARLFSAGEQDARTISVEVGMQNSGLATELARANFPAFPLATVPGAISALTHCILGSVVAGLCRIYPAKRPQKGTLELAEQESAG